VAADGTRIRILTTDDHPAVRAGIAAMLANEPDLEVVAEAAYDMPTIYITAEKDEALRTRMLEQGAVACLFKPFSDTALLEAISTALRIGDES
jgi:DNA-binding NarL/FixJ family response regulator